MKWVTVGLLSIQWLAGCTSSSGIRLIEPPTPGCLRGTNIPVTDSLKPTFRWESQGKGAQYDLAIWDAVLLERSFHAGGKIYLREGLKEPKHRLEITLLPLKEYMWSVKLHEDTAWSKYNYTHNSISVTNNMSLFRTPLGN